MAEVIRRLGILGGTFDPVHNAHLVMAEEARFQLGLDRVLFMPAGDPPHKPLRPVSAAAHRVRMLEMAIGFKPYFGLSRVDLDRGGPSYTSDALRLLRAEWGPETALFFIEGSDSLADILTWHEPERILEQTALAVAQRPGEPVDVADLERRLPALAGRLHWVQMPLLDISSTDLRARVRSGRPISFLLPAAVEEYIVENGLYLK